MSAARSLPECNYRTTTLQDCILLQQHTMHLNEPWSIRSHITQSPYSSPSSCMVMIRWCRQLAHSPQTHAPTHTYTYIHVRVPTFQVSAMAGRRAWRSRVAARAIAPAHAHAKPIGRELPGDCDGVASRQMRVGDSAWVSFGA